MSYDAELGNAARPVLDHFSDVSSETYGYDDQVAYILASMAFARVFLRAGGGSAASNPAVAEHTLSDDVALLEAHFAEDTREHADALAGFRKLVGIAREDA